MKRQTYSVPEAAKVLGIGRSAAYEGIRTGEIPAIRIGKRILVPVAALQKLLAKGEQERDSVVNVPGRARSTSDTGGGHDGQPLGR